MMEKNNVINEPVGNFKALKELLVLQGNALKNHDFTTVQECGKKIAALATLIEKGPKRFEGAENFREIESLIKNCLEQNQENMGLLEKDLAEVKTWLKQLDRQSTLVKSYYRPNKIIPQIIDQKS